MSPLDIKGTLVRCSKNHHSFESHSLALLNFFFIRFQFFLTKEMRGLATAALIGAGLVGYASAQGIGTACMNLQIDELMSRRCRFP